MPSFSVVSSTGWLPPAASRASSSWRPRSSLWPSGRSGSRTTPGGKTRSSFFLLFVIGFVLVAYDRVTATVYWQSRWALARVAAMAARTAPWPGYGDYPDPVWQDMVVDWMTVQVGLGMAIVGLMAAAHRCADRRGGACGYATEADYPFYLLHRAVIVLPAYIVVQWEVGIPVKSTLIAAMSFVLTVATCEVVVRRGVDGSASKK